MLIVLGSVKGSPGVSTFSLALAARWPGAAKRVLVECDPAGGDLAARYDLALLPGLVSLAAARRGSGAATGADGESLWSHTQVLPGGLPVLVAPPGGEQARAALASHATASDLTHLAARLEEVSGWSGRAGLLLVGGGYPDAEVARELGITVMARIPTDPVEAATLNGRTPPRRRPFTRATLSRTAGQVATVLATSHQLLSRPEPSTTADIPVPGEQGSPGVAGPAMTAVASPVLNGRLP